MGYSARRGFTNGKVSGAQRQAELQQKIAEVQEQMNAAQEAVEATEFIESFPLRYRTGLHFVFLGTIRM